MCPRRTRCSASWGRAAARCSRRFQRHGPRQRRVPVRDLARIIDVGYARVRARRITYVGELGYELYVATEFARNPFTTRSSAAGQAFGLKLAGYHALNSLRIEKAYRHWGHDIGTRIPRSRPVSCSA